MTFLAMFDNFLESLKRKSLGQLHVVFMSQASAIILYLYLYYNMNEHFNECLSCFNFDRCNGGSELFN
uniref:Uncharacterized protein n=1 Tax=Glossina palpalis gambiensis TaxID=67801 RepID=A0A1B0BU14_9MUSC